MRQQNVFKFGSPKHKKIHIFKFYFVKENHADKTPFLLYSVLANTLVFLILSFKLQKKSVENKDITKVRDINKANT